MLYYCVLLLAALLWAPSTESTEPVIDKPPTAHGSDFATVTNDDGKSCPSEGCPSGAAGTMPNDTASHNHEQEDNQVVQQPPPATELAEVPGDPAWWDLLSKAKSELARVTHTLHDTLSSITSTFANIVRKIMNEEMYDILATLMTKIGNLMYQPGEALYELFEAILSTIFLLVCLVLSYVLLKLFPLLFVVCFLSTMFLLHYFLGPIAMYKGIYQAAKRLLGVSWIIAKYPYETSIIIMVSIALGFIYSIWIKIKNWRAQRREKEKREDMYRRVCELSKKVAAIESTQETMRKDQEEILKILRELKGDNGSSRTEVQDGNKQAEEG